MSNFPGDLFAYNNPLISIYNPWTQSLTPAVPGGDLVPWRTNTQTFGITLPARIRAFHTIGEALKKPIMGEYLYEGDWAFHTPAQHDFKFFISRFKPYISIEEGTKISISSDANKINEFFRRHGSKARMQYFDPDAGYGVGLLSQMTYGWMRPALPASLLNKYKGIEFTAGYEILESKDNFHLPLIRIRTSEPNITAVIKMVDPHYKASNPYQVVFNFLNNRRWRHFYRPITRNYTSLRIPQIQKEISEHVDHLNGMCLQKFNKQTGLFQSFTIQRIMQQTMVNINPAGVNIGSSLKVNSLIDPKEGYTRPHFSVDRPFLFWLEHEWIKSYPLFIGFFNRDAWVPDR